MRLGFYGKMINKEFWKNKKVFITGNTGFKGSWMSAMLLELGSELKGYSNEIRRQSLFNILELREAYETVNGDICDKEKLANAIDTFKPDILFHMAAQPLVIDSYSIPYETFQINVMGTLNLLEFSREYTRELNFINVTTDKVYENQETLKKYLETDPLGGRDPYSASKACSEIITHSYNASFGKSSTVKIATARSGNVIGGGDFSKDRIFPDIFRALSNKTELQIRNPKAIRPWQHVSEPLKGYLILAQAMDKGLDNKPYAFNFGPSDDAFLPVSEIIKIVHEIIPEELEFKSSFSKKIQEEHEANLLMLDSTKSLSQLNWKSNLNLFNSINLTIQWYLEYIFGDNIRSYTFNQIKESLDGQCK